MSLDNIRAPVKPSPQSKRFFMTVCFSAKIFFIAHRFPVETGKKTFRISKQNY